MKGVVAVEFTQNVASYRKMIRRGERVINEKFKPMIKFATDRLESDSLTETYRENLVQWLDCLKVGGGQYLRIILEMNSCLARAYKAGAFAEPELVVRIDQKGAIFLGIEFPLKGAA